MLLGPHTFNFAAAADDAVAAGAAERVADLAGAVTRAAALIDSPERSTMADQATRFSRAHRGAAERMALEVAALLAERKA
jgi:3-deoxy-D-manno-octulosonic-acid transferase